MAADGNSEAAGQHGSHARLRHVTLKGVLNTIGIAIFPRSEAKGK